ncbi:uncharacterized protein N7500_005606 [Penicillium coprophilum]|uniref:uncharacterized protein n=1 Tax=Penicillium coprophilum TaxID=36646 RepID=UPI00238285CC|nr:uncharacterized protein N7500_005606 [Penicillium coprophilum]KAJ5163776.1 hypothetical protein N7500_005606 [Penicillium coprophilum]
MSFYGKADTKRYWMYVHYEPVLYFGERMLKSIIRIQDTQGNRHILERKSARAALAPRADAAPETVKDKAPLNAGDVFDVLLLAVEEEAATGEDLIVAEQMRVPLMPEGDTRDDDGLGYSMSRLVGGWAVIDSRETGCEAGYSVSMIVIVKVTAHAVLLGEFEEMCDEAINFSELA